MSGGVRRATEKDSARLVAMGKRFVAETGYSELVKVDESRVLDIISRVLSSEDGVVLVCGPESAASGMIAMAMYEHPYSGDLIATELVWWVDPEARGSGVRMLRAAEEWARGRGAARVQMIAPNERVGALYRRLGYAAIETSYQRSL